MIIVSAFDSGNVTVLNIDRRGDEVKIELDIPPDTNSTFLQWFHFRILNAKAQRLRITFPNAHKSSYAAAWNGYKMRYSEAGGPWLQIARTSYDDGTLCALITPQSNLLSIAYFAPYSLRRHQQLIQRSIKNNFEYQSLGHSVQQRSIDLLTIGTGARPWWIIARQHPGETMAEWWTEGLIEGLTNRRNPIVRRLLEKVTLYVVPNMNPDGSWLGNLRTNAAGINLNREWLEPSLERSPEVYWTRQHMHDTGVDFCLDVHGDETLPYNFIAGLEGIPSCTPELLSKQHAFMKELVRACPDFQTVQGYGIDAPGAANLSVASNYIAETFGCVALTLEQPFKDTIDAPVPATGWSPERAKDFGKSSIVAMWNWLNQRSQ